MNLKKIHHVAIICSNYEISKEFYVNILGLKIISEVYRKDRQSYKLDLSVGGNNQIELFSFPQSPKRLSYPEASGLRHLAFEVDSVYDAIKELTDKNVITQNIRIDEFTGKKFIFFNDPDDLPIELYEK